MSLDVHVCTPGPCGVHCRTEAERALDAAEFRGLSGRPLKQRELAEMFAINERSIRDAKLILAAEDLSLLARVRAGKLSLRSAAREVRSGRTAVSTAPVAKMLHGDFREVLRDLPDNSVEAIVTDVPTPVHGKYDPDLYSDVGVLASRLLVSGGVFAALVDQKYMPDLYRGLAKHLDYAWMFSYVAPNGMRKKLRLFSFWRPVLVFSSGPFRGAGFESDLIKAGWDLIEHVPRKDQDYSMDDLAKSISGMGEIVKRVSSPGDLVLDPFCGSNATGRACADLGFRYIGCSQE